MTAKPIPTNRTTSTADADVNPGDPAGARQQADKPDGRGRFFHPPSEPRFRREEAALYAEPRSLAQRAGVPVEALAEAAAKELADNSCDATDAAAADPYDVEVEVVAPGVIRVSDRAGGIAGTPGEIAGLFSVHRAMESSKLLPRPTRGAIGNGLRVAAGVALCTGGEIEVRTRSLRLVIRPDFDGDAITECRDDLDHLAGTEVILRLGDRAPEIRRPTGDHDLGLTLPAIRAARAAEAPAWKRPAPAHWLDAARWATLLRSAPAGMTARQLVERLDGCSGSRRSAEIVGDLKGRTCASLTPAEGDALLEAARAASRQPKADCFVPIGPHFVPLAGYAKAAALDDHGRPVLVEAWASVEHRTQGRSAFAALLVNRTAPPGADLSIAPSSEGRPAIFGCNLAHNLDVPVGAYRVTLAVTAPVVPVLSESKTPDLAPWHGVILGTLERAIRAARKATEPAITAERVTQRAAVLLDLIPQAVEAASDGGRYRYNLRAVFYRLRDAVAQRTGRALDYGNFTSVVTDYEAIHGDLPGCWRNARGSFVVPHTREQVALGTLTVERYQREPWRFANVLIAEKEDALPLLAAAGFGDKWDCMLVSSSGMTTRALRDLIDKIAETRHAEPIRCFVMHDADAAGGIIAETLQRETRARGARLIEVVDLGLFPWEATARGLPIETFDRGPKRRAVAQSVIDYDAANGTTWAEWLQTNRVELNAMVTRQMIEWLDAEFERHGAERVDPPGVVLAGEFDRALRLRIEAEETSAILARMQPLIDRRTAERIAAIPTPDPAELRQRIEAERDADPVTEWRETIQRAADEAG